MTPAQQIQRRTRNTAQLALAVAYAIEAAEVELAALHAQLAELTAPPAVTLPGAVVGPVCWEPSDPTDITVDWRFVPRPGTKRAVLVR